MMVLRRSRGPRARLEQGWARGLFCFLGVFMLVLGLSLSLAARPTAAASDTVYVVQVTGTIEPGLAAYLARTVREAEGASARAVIVEIDTPGGRLDAALQARETLLSSSVRTIAFVDREAFSAGALIAIAADDIYMAPGAVLGAATPVNGAGVRADEKTVSAVRATFKTTAEVRGRDATLAQAMVDPAVAVEGFPAGRLVTLTTADAEARGFIAGVVPDRAALLRAAGLDGATVREVGISPAEQLVRALTDPVLGALLFGLGVLLIVGSLFAGEVGIFTGLGVGTLALFFWGHTLAGLAGWEGIALAALGLLLIGLEVFVIPGFGVAGILGGVALLGSLVVSVTSGGWPTAVATENLARSVVTLLVTFVLGGGLLLRFLPASARRRGLVLQTASGPYLADSRGDELGEPGRSVRRRGIWRLAQALTGEAARGEQHLSREARSSLTGARGRALADLRPGGFALIDGVRVDVVTRGEVILAGATIEVVLDEGYRRIVRQVGPEEPEVEML